MLSNLMNPYKVFLPKWVFDSAVSDEEIEENARSYLSKSYPERYLIEIEGRFAICGIK